MTYNKLVRDNIPEIIAKQGKRVTFRSLKSEELEKALKDKLVEEVQELIYAKTDDELFEEAADILEVLDFILHEHKTNIVSVEGGIRIRKAKQKGKFWNGYFLESVED